MPEGLASFQNCFDRQIQVGAGRHFAFMPTIKNGPKAMYISVICYVGEVRTTIICLEHK